MDRNYNANIVRMKMSKRRVECDSDPEMTPSAVDMERSEQVTSDVKTTCDDVSRSVMKRNVQSDDNKFVVAKEEEVSSGVAPMEKKGAGISIVMGRRVEADDGEMEDLSGGCFEPMKVDNLSNSVAPIEKEGASASKVMHERVKVDGSVVAKEEEVSSGVAPMEKKGAGVMGRRVEADDGEMEDFSGGCFEPMMVDNLSNGVAPIEKEGASASKVMHERVKVDGSVVAKEEEVSSGVVHPIVSEKGEVEDIIAPVLEKIDNGQLGCEPDMGEADVKEKEVEVGKDLENIDASSCFEPIVEISSVVQSTKSNLGKGNNLPRNMKPSRRMDTGDDLDDDDLYEAVAPQTSEQRETELEDVAYGNLLAGHQLPETTVCNDGRELSHRRVEPDHGGNDARACSFKQEMHFKWSDSHRIVENIRLCTFFKQIDVSASLSIVIMW
eukprot:Em0002g122a